MTLVATVQQCRAGVRGPSRDPTHPPTTPRGRCRRVPRPTGGKGTRVCGSQALGLKPSSLRTYQNRGSPRPSCWTPDQCSRALGWLGEPQSPGEVRKYSGCGNARLLPAQPEGQGSGWPKACSFQEVWSPALWAASSISPSPPQPPKLPAFIRNRKAKDPCTQPPPQSLAKTAAEMGQEPGVAPHPPSSVHLICWCPVRF